MMTKKIVSIVVALLSISLVGRGDVLLWTVNGDATVDDTSSVYAFLSPVPYDELHNPAARVKVSGGGLSSPIYLDNYWEDKDSGEWGLDGGDVGVVVGDSESGYYGAKYQQSHVPSGITTEALVSIELGKMTWNDNTYMSGVFEALAESDEYTYEQIRAFMYPTFDLNHPKPDWVPMNYHTVPEPSSALFCIFGIGLLMLTRRVD